MVSQNVGEPEYVTEASPAEGESGHNRASETINMIMKKLENQNTDQKV